MINLFPTQCVILFIFFGGGSERRKEEGLREGGKREGERNIDLLFYLCMHSLVASCMCHDWRWNRQPWHSGTTP